MAGGDLQRQCLHVRMGLAIAASPEVTFEGEGELYRSVQVLRDGET